MDAWRDSRQRGLLQGQPEKGWRGLRQRAPRSLFRPLKDSTRIRICTGKAARPELHATALTVVFRTGRKGVYSARLMWPC
jgi:hypothetical protein